MSRPRMKGMFVSGPRCFEGLLADPLVSDWIGVYRSANTRDHYLLWLNVVCVRSGLLLGQFLELDSDEARRVVMSIVSEYLKQDKMVAARQIQTAAKSFLSIMIA